MPGYEVLAKLGQGGMGAVYQARHVATGRLVAIKRMLEPLAGGQPETARFYAEAEALSRLRHPNVVEFIEVGSHEGQPFLVMELVTGGNLDRWLAGKSQQPREAAELVETLARAAHAAHQVGVIHRDLKPLNVLLAGEGSLAGCVPKLTDFGLAKRLDASKVLTSTGAVLGTPSYMAPEQAEGKVRELGPGVDVWALGVILFQCLTGRLPFVGSTLLQTLELIRSQDPPPLRGLDPAIPRDLETICLKCLNKDPARRYASAAELADDLRCFLEDRPIRARRVGLAERAVKWRRRNPTLAAGLGIAVLLLVVAGGATLGYWHRYRRVTFAYFASHIDRLGEPIGVGPLEPAEARRRASTYRFATRGGKVEEVALVNGVGSLITETMRLPGELEDGSPTPCRYIYRRDDQGKLLEKNAYDRADGVLWSLRFTSETAANYVDSRGFVQVPAGIGSSHYHFVYDEAGFVQEVHFVDASGQPRADPDQTFGQRYQRGVNGTLESVTFLGHNLKPTVNKRRRYATARLGYDKRGNLIRVAFFDASNHPMLNRTGCATWQGRRDEAGNLVEERFLDVRERPVVVRDGYSSRRSTFDTHGNRVSEAFFDAEGKPVLGREGYASRKVSHDEYGWMVEERFFDVTGRPTVSRQGSHRRTQEADERGFVIEEAHFGPDGLEVAARNGVARTKTRYDNRGNPIEVSFYGADGKLTAHPDGAARYVARYDAHGTCVGAACFGPDGAPSYWKSGYSRWTATFDQRGNRTEWACFDDKDRPVLHADGYARVTARFNEWGMVEESYFGVTGERVNGKDGFARRTTRYDDRGNAIEVATFDAKGKFVTGPDGYARHVAVFDAFGNRTQITYFGLEGKPAPNVNGVTQVRTTYDDQANPVHELYFDAENHPTANKNRVAGVRSRYNHAGDQVEEVCLGVDGKPAKSSGGYVRRTAVFDGRGNVIEQRYFDAAGKPTLGGEGYACQTRKYDERGNVLKEAYFGVEGHPIGRKDGYAAVCQRYDARGDSTDVWFFGTDGKPLLTSYGYAHETARHDDSRQLIELAYWDVQDRPVASANGYHRVRWKYDDRHHVVEVSSHGTHGNLVSNKEGYARMTSRFDERGNLVEHRYFGPDGNPTANGEGVTAVLTHFDERHRKTEARMLTATGYHVQSYDEKGRVVQIAWFNSKSKLVMGPEGYARSVMHFDAVGRNIGFEKFGPDGRPTPGHEGFARLERTFDERGHKVQETGYGNGNRIIIRYNQRGNATSISYFDANEKPTVNDEGYFRLEKKYDDGDNVIEQSYFGLDDKPTLHKDGYASVTWRFDREGNQIEMAFAGKDGQPVIPKRRFYARTVRRFRGRRKVEESMYGVQGQLLARLNYDQTGAATTLVYDSKTRVTRTTYYAPDNKIRVSKEGYSGFSSKYNERDEEIERRYFGADGKPVRTRVVVGVVAAEGEAKRLDLRPGDVVKTFNGQATPFADALLRLLQSKAGSATPRSLTIEREGKTITVRVLPVMFGASLHDVAVP